VRFKIHTVLGTEDLQSKVNQSSRSPLVESVEEDAARLFLHRASMFSGADFQPRFQ